MKRIHWLNINTPAFWDEIWRKSADCRHYDHERLERITSKVRQGMAVLDLGAGVYGPVQWLTEHTNIKAALFALDLSPAAVKIVRHIPGARGRIRYLVGNALETGFPAERFDVTIAGELLDHMKAPAYLIAEMVRITRPGGWISISVLNASSPGAIVHGDYPEHLYEIEPGELLGYLAAIGLAEYEPVGNYHIFHCRKWPKRND